MRARRRESVSEIKRRLFKYNLISAVATMFIALALYALATGKGGQIHAILANQSFVVDLLIGAGVLELLVMARIARLKKLKQGVLYRRVASRA